VLPVTLRKTLKIALLSPYSEISSIGIRSISAYLKSFGIATRIVFLPLQKSYYSREDFYVSPALATATLQDTTAPYLSHLKIAHCDFEEQWYQQKIFTPHLSGV